MPIVVRLRKDDVKKRQRGTQPKTPKVRICKVTGRTDTSACYSCLPNHTHTARVTLHIREAFSAEALGEVGWR